MTGVQRHRHSSLHDVELAQLSAGGDRAAFGELVRRHGASLRALMRRMGAAVSEADDLAQDAFILAFQSIADFRGEGAFEGWIKKIAARLCSRRLQRDRRLRALLESAADDPPAPGPADAAARLDLDEALRRLGEAERICVSLCYGAGLTHSEAADALNLPLGTVKSHVKRGLDRMKLQLSIQELDRQGRRGDV
ncbi:MAG TPA: RNA polymerase sigma factor [Phenylobacterium sp.]|nr:RNA polymerase sigma factor [Phenylobacterium sp.]